ncbi:DUF6351 family protein [Dasania sp. GY-MA-18]|uniref:DUF6351 family protein n=1 Tax=Dasania phycosphaerae TaxID=2950436 RepID=A0A9J6RGB2_9GAMM|nr:MULTISPECIES: DUF6351 family protein [Dasania]MCR8921258.1 DUF6351 family protein [Dasania sp. GY-MA-18]MCZ0863686.1 DUF6351 family protein [Dasania phycosphaerae]MCZ0867414.1 DUF6351 family protein [Dasania phycosphaerae]
MKKLLKYCAVLFTGLFLLSLGAVLYVLAQVRPMPEQTKQYVVGMPAMADELSTPAAYSGLHPRYSSRPNETFSFPISLGSTGPVQPLFAGANRYPFLCGRNKVHSLQPMIDNQHRLGVPVYGGDGDKGLSEEIIGYSKDCSHLTQASYFYNRLGTAKFYPLAEANNDIAKITVNGREIDFIVRLETGTINRYFYGLAVLKGAGSLAEPSVENWNQRLIYQFRGGVGIGKRQGNIKSADLLERRYEAIKQGYAVVYSTANQTSNHYNIWLAEDTALRVKKQFQSLYGEPLYTVGIGGSGGAIQQYLFAQNNPELLDAAIALYSYPDMVTQTTYVMDCEPLEYYFDVTDAANPLWRSWKKRSLIEGVNAQEEADNEFAFLSYAAALLNGELPKISKGSSECVQGWRGLTPVVHNPNFIHFSKKYRRRIADNEHWTHWDDLKQFYGVDEHGYANSTWDNVGVQYGLQALRNGDISPELFLNINSHVGGWKPFHEMEQEKYWLMLGKVLPVDFSQWSHHNMLLSEGAKPAARTRGSLAAMHGAYRSGHVFLGYADIPIIDLRHYLEDELDMHHSTASFASRVRMLKGQGHADNQLIWMTEKPHIPIVEALSLLDQWLQNQRLHPDKTIAANKPAAAQDACFNAAGQLLAEGEDVWNGDWNQQPDGACSQVYPRYKTSREVAGDSIAGDVFKCQLQPVAQAMAAGVYGRINMQPLQAQLERVFPEGVCDYSQKDAGLPVSVWLGEPSQQLVASPTGLGERVAAVEEVELNNAALNNTALNKPVLDDATLHSTSVDKAAGHPVGRSHGQGTAAISVAPMALSLLQP